MFHTRSRSHLDSGGYSYDQKEKGKDPAKAGRQADPGALCGVHGSNRLGGNSITETIVFGRIAGTNAAELAKSVLVP